MSVLWSLHKVPREEAQQVDPTILPDRETADRLYEASRGHEEIDIGRNWNVVHYMLTGQSGQHDSPLSRAIFGRYDIDGNGGYYYLAPDDVRDVAAALADLTREDYEPRMSVEVWRGHYRGYVAHAGHLEGSADELEEIRDCYLQLARRGDGALILLG